MKTADRIWEIVHPGGTVGYTDDVETADDYRARGHQVTEYVPWEEHPLRRCGNCDTITELVTPDQIEQSLARRMIAAEDVGWKRGEARYEKRYADAVFALNQIAAGKVARTEVARYAQDAITEIRGKTT